MATNSNARGSFAERIARIDVGIALLAMQSKHKPSLQLAGNLLFYDLNTIAKTKSQEERRLLRDAIDQLNAAESHNSCSEPDLPFVAGITTALVHGDLGMPHSMWSAHDMLTADTEFSIYSYVHNALRAMAKLFNADTSYDEGWREIDEAYALIKVEYDNVRAEADHLAAVRTETMNGLLSSKVLTEAEKKSLVQQVA